MAITVGTITSGSINNSVTLTISQTCAVGTTVLVAPVIFGDNGRGLPTSVTYNGSAMTLQVSDMSADGSVISAIYTQLAPATGSAHNLVVTISGANAGDYIAAAGVPVLGSDTVSPVDATAHQNGKSTTITTVAANDLIINCANIFNSGDNTAPTAANGETTVYNINTSSNHWRASGYKFATAAGSYTTGWTTSAQNADSNTISVIAIKPAVASSNSNFFAFM